MKPFYIAVLILSLAFSALQGQDLPVAYREDFDSTSTQWGDYQSQDITQKTIDGYFVLDKRSLQGNWHVTIGELIEQDKDYEIEASLTQIAGVENHGYGLTFHGPNLDNSWNFVVSSNGYIRINKWVNNEYSDVLAWKQSGYVKPMKQTNILRVRKHGSEFTFFLNGEEVYRCPAPRTTGTMMGFHVNEHMTVAMDYFVLRTSRKPINLAKNLPASLKRTRLSDAVNSSSTEKSPLISPDGTILYVTREQYDQSPIDKVNSEVYVSQKMADGTWSTARNIGRPINNDGHNFVVSSTPDNNTLLLGNTYNGDGSPKGSGFSISERTIDGWSLPRTVEIDDYVNRNKYIEACLSADGGTLLMTVERDSCLGERDIFVSFKHEDGTWSRPQHTGNTINSYLDEAAPFLAADGITLYFTSAGHSGFGSSDIFMSRRLDDTWKNWSEPENLGPIINTKGWDAYFNVPADGAYAYLIANGPSGSLDIWQVDLPPSLRPRPVVIVSGIVTDASTQKPMAARIRYERLSDGAELGTAMSDPATGAYKIVLTGGEEYGFRADAEDYYAVSRSLSTKDLTTYKEIRQDLTLEPVVIGRGIRINNLFFDVGKSELRPESRPDLDRLVAFLKANGTIAIELGGHTDDVGKDKDNLILSDSRAKAVMAYITEHGIDASRISAKGYGETKPQSMDKTDEGRQLNRRVEFVITRK